jgi:hypothetical protein
MRKHRQTREHEEVFGVGKCACGCQKRRTRPCDLVVLVEQSAEAVVPLDGVRVARRLRG